MAVFSATAFRTIFKVLGSAILLILVLILFPIIMLLLSPLYIWRFIVLVTVKLFYRDIDEIFWSQDVFFSMDKWHTCPDSGIPIVSILEGSVDMDKFCRDCSESFTKRLRPDNTLKYDRLQQFPVPIGGFYFWKWDRDFSIENHIKLVTDVSLNDSNLPDYIAKMTRNPYQKNRPLWDISFILNFNGDKNQTVMISRMHHCFADGFSTLKLFLNALTVEDKSAPTTRFAKPTKIKRTQWQNLKRKVTLLFGLPYIYLREVSKLRDCNPLHDPKNIKLTGDWVASLTPKIPIREVKDAKKKLMTPFTAIITSALAGGLQTYLEKYIVASKIPKKMHFLYPNPLPGHPDDRLTNHWAMGTTAITLNIKNIDERLKRTKAEFFQLVKSPFAMVNYYMFKILGTLPASMADNSTRFQGFTFVLSNFPGPTAQYKIFDYPVKDQVFWLPLMRNLTGINFSILSFRDGLRIGILADTAYIPDKSHLEELSMDVYKELRKIIAHEPEPRINCKHLIKIEDIA